MPIIGVIDSAKSGNLYAASYESISTVTVGAGGASSITFSSIPSTYTHLQLRLSAREVTGGFDQMYMRVNGDTGANYSKHNVGGSGASGLVYGGSASTSSVSIGVIGGSNQVANTFSVSVTDFLDYANTSKYKTIRELGGCDNNGDGDIFFNSGLWQSTSAVNTLTFTVGGGTAFSQYTQFALYGIKG